MYDIAYVVLRLRDGLNRQGSALFFLGMYWFHLFIRCDDSDSVKKLCQPRAAMELLIVFNSVYSWVTCLSLSTSLITLILWSLSKTTKKPKEPGDHVPFTGDLEIGQSFHNDEVLVFPGRTSHTRLFPKAHSFSYGFLIAVVPVRNCKSNWFAAIDNENKPWWRRGWLRVDPRDHLHRGDDDHGLSYKLDRYLESKV